MKIKSAVARSHGAALRLEALELDDPRRDEILVKVVASGVGQADIDAIDGRLAMALPFVPGAEGAGIVERVGRDVRDLSPGDAVVVAFDFCGRCDHCATGRLRDCVEFAALNLSGRRRDGSIAFGDADGRAVNGRFFGQSAFATHLLCRASRAVKVAGDAPLEILACLGGDMLRGAGTILHGFHLRSGDSLVISGAGAIGLAATMVAKARGAKLIVVADADETRGRRASDLGAHVIVHGASVHGPGVDGGADLADVVRSLVGEGATFVLETTGIPAARQACLASVARGGRCAFVDLADRQPGETSPHVLPVDVHTRPDVLVGELVALHAAGALPLEQMVEFFAFDHVNDALDALRRGDVVKPVLRFPLGGFGAFDRALVEGAAEDAPAEDAPETASTDNETDGLVKS